MDAVICAAEGCTRQASRRGWCSLHYKRVMKYGDPTVNRRSIGRNICVVEDCTRVVYGHGYCSMHYKRWRKWGDPLINKNPLDRTPEERFWVKVSGRKGAHCWIWLGSRDQLGYGTFRLNDRVVKAHRLAYQWLVGPIPDDLTVDHLCFNPSCVNPGHMEIVTAAENVSRGRRTHAPSLSNISISSRIESSPDS